MRSCGLPSKWAASVRAKPQTRSQCETARCEEAPSRAHRITQASRPVPLRQPLPILREPARRGHETRSEPVARELVTQPVMAAFGHRSVRVAPRAARGVVARGGHSGRIRFIVEGDRAALRCHQGLASLEEIAGKLGLNRRRCGAPRESFTGVQAARGMRHGVSLRLGLDCEHEAACAVPC